MKKAFLLFLLLSVVIGSCSKSNKNTGNFKYEVNNIKDLSIQAGDTAYMNVEVKLLEGDAGDVNLSIAGLPPDVTASLSSGGSTPDFNTIITFVANKTVINGIFPLKLTAASLMGKKVYNFKLTVGGSSDTTGDTTHHDPFTYAVNNTGNMTVQQGGSVSKDLEVKLLTGTTQNVSLALTGVPTGVTPSFTVASGMPTFSTSLSFNASATAAAGTYPIALKSTSSTGIQTYNFNLTVSSTAVPFNYTVNGVNNVSVQQGNSGTLALAVKTLAGTPEAVNLSLTGLPAGATSNFSAASGTPDFNSTLTINTTNSVATGTYPLTLKSTSASTTAKTFTFNLVVTGTTSDCAQGAAGTYASQDSCTATAGAPVVTKTGTNQIKIAGLAGYLTYTIDANATINCTNHTITIPSQAITAIPIPGATVSGTGTFTDNSMTIHYTISVLTYTQTCRVDLTR
jgi:uncharacterized membrane protein